MFLLYFSQLKQFFHYIQLLDKQESSWIAAMESLMQFQSLKAIKYHPALQEQIQREETSQNTCNYSLEEVAITSLPQHNLKSLKKLKNLIAMCKISSILEEQVAQGQKRKRQHRLRALISYQMEVKSSYADKCLKRLKSYSNLIKQAYKCQAFINLSMTLYKRLILI